MRFDLRSRSLPGKFLEVDPDGKRANDSSPSIQTDLRMRHSRFDDSFGKQALQTGCEIGPVVIALESDHVELEQGLQDRFLPRQLFEYVGTRKRGVQEEPHGSANPGLPHGFGGEHEVIVMHPDKVVVGGGLRDNPSKLTIHLLIDFPILGVEIAARRHVVKQRPDDFVGEAGIELRDLFFGQRDRAQGVGAVLGGFRQERLDMLGRGSAGPADPDAPLVVANPPLER